MRYCNRRFFVDSYSEHLASPLNYEAERSSEDDVAVNLLRGLNNLRKEGTFCDAALKVGEKTIRVHKIVISLSSPYFMAMFSGNFSESNQQEISIKELDGDCLEQLIEYMYTGTLQISDAMMMKDLLLTASFLQISSAEELCCKFMENKLNVDNCIEYALFAENNSIKRLVDSSLEVANFYFIHIFSKNEYLELEFEELKLFTQKLKESHSPEDLIYSFVMRWINYSHETRISFMKELLELLNPSFISPSVLHSSEIIKTPNTVFTTWATGGDATRSLNELGDHILVSQRLGKFRPLRVNIFSQAKHRQIELLPDRITDGSYVCNGYYIYHQGGWCLNEELLTDSYVYHPIRSEWVQFVPLQEARAYHHSCVLNGKIFSVGGSDGVRALTSVEFTDIHTGQRGFIDPLPLAKERAGLGLRDNSIYVVGGNDRGKSYKCIHRFDAREGVWQELTPSPYRAGATSCAVLGDNIYTTHPDTLQRYDIRANDWALISAQYKRYPPEVFALDNTLFGLFNDHVARFVSEGGKWDNQRTLKCNLPYLQVSTNLLFPNINEEEIADPVFEGYRHSVEESEWGTDDERESLE